ncbi:MAG TPA: PD-(D/E)XK nuclease family protein [Pirellulaceae bacterium]|jgi:hypothetical protein|nr:PD-(D/E)XK nuclease family protein [Pirellulaceae bacterium]
MSREFLDFRLPALPALVERLEGDYRKDGRWDLSNVLLVLPGLRAVHRTMELLADRAQAERLFWNPPEAVTIGRLPERLYPVKKPIASEWMQRLAWVRAAQSFPAEEIAPALPHLPEEREAAAWLDLGDLLARQHRELAGEGHRFEDVLRVAVDLPGFQEEDRWRTLAKLQARYLEILDSEELWDLQTARLFAAEHGECSTDRQIVLAATADLPRVIVRMLEQVRDRVTAYVYAPNPWSVRFDEWGRLVASEWEQVDLNVPLAEVFSVENSAEQAQCALERLAAAQEALKIDSLSVDQISISIPDERVVPQIRRRFAEERIKTYWNGGTPLRDSAPYRLLETVAAYVDSRSYRDFAALLRHPDVERLLRSRGIAGDYLTALDDAYQSSYPVNVEPSFWNVEFSDAERSSSRESVSEKRSRSEALATAGNRLHEFLGTLLDESPRRLGEWAAPWRDLFTRLYEDYEPLEDSRAGEDLTRIAAAALRDAIDALGGVSDGFQPQTTAGEAMRLALHAVRSAKIYGEPDPEAVDLIGWLDLLLDDAPVRIVVGFNEGIVPQSTTSDMFLPNSLRTALGIDDNARRYARDAYVTACLLDRQPRVAWILGRTDDEGSPLAPSRLLFACPAKDAARRVRVLFGDGPSYRVSQGRAWKATLPESRFPIPMPVKPAPRKVTELTPTSFRSYLACPYRFYLEKVLGLKEREDDADELDAGGFGDLTHAVLEAVAAVDDLKGCTEAERLAAELTRLAEAEASVRFGPRPPASVQLQIEQLRLRLAAYAERQAAIAAEGWETIAVEVRLSYDIDVDGEPFRLSGIVDRIDRHRESGRFRVCDYKTTASAPDPDEAHRKRDRETKELRWYNVQLPVYRLLVANEYGVDPREVGMAFIKLPGDLRKVAFAPAEWSDAELAEADEVVRDVIRKVRAEVYWPPIDPEPYLAPYDLWAKICQTQIFGRRPLDEEFVS